MGYFFQLEFLFRNANFDAQNRNLYLLSAMFELWDVQMLSISAKGLSEIFDYTSKPVRSYLLEYKRLDILQNLGFTELHQGRFNELSGMLENCRVCWRVLGTSEIDLRSIRDFKGY